ncbi:astacin-like metalloendopeptidase, partial [Dasypus novemcinctus]|uniref:astacin-like metalloendopeptidase n=1 Tax=Dasypus novemcinctus TaxID=9361 RepID=UPI0039C8D052
CPLRLAPSGLPWSVLGLPSGLSPQSPFQLLSATSGKWPKSGGRVEVPFLLSSEYDARSRAAILAAFAEFARFTCVRFVPYNGQRDFVSIVPMSGCFSGVGRAGGPQLLSLAPACLRAGPGIALHELMHLLGFWHEHARADRDRYIRVDWKEVRPGFEINFIKSRSSNMLAPYDYSSVMHYGRLAFSRRGAATLVPLWAPGVHMGQRWNLSASDVTRVLRLYGCSPRGAGSQSPPPASRPHLQRLLKALLADPGHPRPGGPRAAAGPRASPPRPAPPVLSEWGEEAPPVPSPDAGSRPSPE